MLPPEDTILWRLQVLEGSVGALDKDKAEAKDVAALADEVKSLRLALIVFSLSMVGGGGMFLIGVLTLLQNG